MDTGFFILLDLFNQRWDDGGTLEYKISLLVKGNVLTGRVVSLERFQDFVPPLMKQMLEMGENANAEVAVALDEPLTVASMKVFYLITTEGIPLRVDPVCVEGWSLLK